MDLEAIGGDFNLALLRKEIKNITKSLQKQNRKHSTKKTVKTLNQIIVKVDNIKLNDSGNSSPEKMKPSKLRLMEAIYNSDLSVPDTATLIKDRFHSTGNTKETFLNRMRMKRSICRFCPKQQKLSKPCQKHKLSRMKGHSFGCKFCGEHFEFESFLIDHIRSLHSKLLVFEKISRRAVKGMIPNIHRFQNVLSKYSNLR